MSIANGLKIGSAMDLPSTLSEDVSLGSMSAAAPSITAPSTPPTPSGNFNFGIQAMAPRPRMLFPPSPIVKYNSDSNSILLANTEPATQEEQLKSYEEFWKDLLQFHERRGSPVVNLPKLNGKLVNLYQLYTEVTQRGGFIKVNDRDEWDEVCQVLECIDEKCVNSDTAMKFIYKRFLEKYEKLNYFGEDPDKLEALETAIDSVDIAGGRMRMRYANQNGTSIFGQTSLPAVPLSYNYKQHVVSMDKRRHFNMSTNLLKPTPLEKLMLSLMSPLPNDQDFAMNVCAIMNNDTKNAFRLAECPKLLDVLLAHAGVYADFTLRSLFEHIYERIRKQSQFKFWRDLLYDKPHILAMYADDEPESDNGLDDKDISAVFNEVLMGTNSLSDRTDIHFLNLSSVQGKDEYMGQRVLQVVNILRDMSFVEGNITLLARNKTFLRYIVMGSNIRWSNMHIHILETAGNVAGELDLSDPTTNELARCLMATICDGIDSSDRSVILNCLEILQKLCAKEGNINGIQKCLNLEFYKRLFQLLSLKDIMLLIFNLEAIYALSSLGSRSCSLVMQVRGAIDQLVSLLTIDEASYGPEGCIMMQLVEPSRNNVLHKLSESKQQIGYFQQLQKSLHLPAQKKVIQPMHQISQTLQQVGALDQQVQQKNINPMKEKIFQTQAEQEIGTQHTPAIKQSTTTGILQHHKSSNNIHQPLKQIEKPLHLVVPQQQSQPKTNSTSQQEPKMLPKLPTPPNAITSSSDVTPTTPPPPIQSFTHDDEQYALNWLASTCERTATNNNRIEQQDLYRIYLTHCQKAGKESLVNHYQFPHLVRMLFGQSVGPVSVRLADGGELSGNHYISLRLRPQPLPMQSVGVTTAESASVQNISIRKEQPPDVKMKLPAATSTSTLCITPTPVLQTSGMNTQVETSSVFDATSISAQQQTTSSLIKSLLANKVNQRQQKQKEQILQTTPQPIKVAPNAISALVNNPIMQHASVKVGQTTIKPLNPHHAPLGDKKCVITESAPPPLAPLSGGPVIGKDQVGRTVIFSSQALTDLSSAARKRKLTSDDNRSENKRINIDHGESNSNDDIKVTPSKRAANLYAELAAEIMEEGDADDVPIVTSAPALSIPDAGSLISKNKGQQLCQASLPRQVIFQSSGAPSTHISQLKLTSQNGPQVQPLPTQIIQQVLQQQTCSQQQQLQYVLTTNHQTGQAYLVAQPSVNPSTQTQALLLAQMPQQQGSGSKTIYILQQPAISNASAAVCAQQLVSTGPVVSGSQKLIMTTSQGQQMLVSQRPQNPHPQYILNTGPSANTTILTRQPVASTQMSPSLLSQLNQIPATIKPYQPQSPSNMQTIATRINKSVSLSPILPSPSNPNNTSTQIPQLQQHQSIIQQSIISSPAIEKRPTVTCSRPQSADSNDSTNLQTQTVPAKQQICTRQLTESIPGNVQSTIISTSTTSAQENLQKSNSGPSAATEACSSSHSSPLITPNRPPLDLMANQEKQQSILPHSCSAQPQMAAVAHTSSLTTTAAEQVSLTPREASIPNPVPVSSIIPADANWLYICDWRNCPRHKFKSLNDLQHHVFTVHCPDHLDISAEIFCQWGAGPGQVCDTIPRKRFSLMTHIGDRHLTNESLHAAVQRRISTGVFNIQPSQQPVTIVRNVDAATRMNSSSPALSSESSNSAPLSTVPASSSSALQAIKRNLGDFCNPKQLAEEIEGPVTKSIRLTAALILRNLVTCTTSAKRSLRRYESSLSNIALSSAEASVTVSQILYELQD